MSDRNDSNNNNMRKIIFVGILVLLCIVTGIYFTVSTAEKDNNYSDPTSISETSSTQSSDFSESLGVSSVTPSSDASQSVQSELSKPQSSQSEPQSLVSEPQQSSQQKPKSTVSQSTQSEPQTVNLRFRNKNLLDQHYEKHGKDMGFSSAAEYEKAAAAVPVNPAALHKIEKEDGDDVYYIEATNEFVVVSTDGYIRTYFLPDSGKRYFDKQ